MAGLLIKLHSFLGLTAVFLPVFILTEISKTKEKRDQSFLVKIALTILVLIIFSWIAGGYYYVVFYEAKVKPLIKANQPWVHEIIMESKEHIFMYLPFLALLLFFLVKGKVEKNKTLIKIIAGSIIVLGILIGLMGVTIASSH